MERAQDRFVGQSALIVAVPETGMLVDRWRGLYDPTAPGVPPHVSVVYPFLPDHRLNSGVLKELATVFAEQGAFQTTFERSERFPGVYYLAPEPAGDFLALTSAVVNRWPEAQPYGGAFEEVIPHLTVAHTDDEVLHRRIDQSILPLLPVSAMVSDVRLIACTGDGWVLRGTFPLRPPATRQARSSGTARAAHAGRSRAARTVIVG
jgi:hypothetical protein